MNELLEELHNMLIFSKPNLKLGYHQIRMRDKDTTDTTFHTHQRHYEYIVMPFGLSNSPTTFQAVMNNIFCLHLWWFVLVFFDDIIVYNRDGKEDARHLDTILSLLEVHHLYINVKKYFFFQVEMEYLGHYISAQGVTTRLL